MAGNVPRPRPDRSRPRTLGSFTVMHARELTANTAPLRLIPVARRNRAPQENSIPAREWRLFKRIFPKIRHAIPAHGGMGPSSTSPPVPETGNVRAPEKPTGWELLQLRHEKGPASPRVQLLGAEHLLRLAPASDRTDLRAATALRGAVTFRSSPWRASWRLTVPGYRIPRSRFSTFWA